MSLPQAISNTISNLVTAQQATPVDTGEDFLYLKMTKQGEWVYGAEETEVDPESFFVVDPKTYAQGFVAWDSESGVLVAEEMAVAGQSPIIMANLPELPEGIKWQAQTAFALKGLEGKEKNLQLLYKVSSKGGKAAIAISLKQIIDRGKAGNADVAPLVQLESTSYKHKKYGKIFTPVLAIDEWLDVPEDGVSEPVVEPAVAIAEPDEPKRGKRTRRTA